MNKQIKIISLVLALFSISIFHQQVFAQSYETSARMMAESVCELYGQGSEVCASAKRDIVRGSSGETSARMMAESICELYGQNSEVCASAKRDVHNAIARDSQPYGLTRPSPIGRGATNFPPSSTQYETEKNTITFLNQSGEPALVKVRGATNTQTFVPNGSSSTVNASGGTHYILVRYGSSPPYTYSKGESFSVNETATQYSAISITLHKVVHGNYSSSSTSQAEFDSR